MRTFASGAAELSREYGIEIGRWEQYGTRGLPFGAMWCVIPPGGSSEEDCHPERELAVVVTGGGEVEAVATGERRPAPLGTAALLDSEERHVWHNGSADEPLVLLSIYWMPDDAR
jgi:Cupin domain